MILLSGAGGFVGRDLLGEMRSAGFQGIRPLLQAGEMVPAGMKEEDCRRCDIRDAGAVLQVCEGSIDAVVHLAGIVASADEALNHAVNAQGTQNLIAAARQKGARHFVLMSAAAVKFKTMNAYGRSKLLAEEMVKNSGMPYTIVRSPLIIGKGCQEFDRFVDYVMKFPGLVPVFGSGKTIKRPIGIRDVSQFILKVIKAAPQNKTYEIACAENISLDELIDLILQYQGAKKMKLHIPLGLSLFMADLAEKILGEESPVTRDILLGLNEDIEFNIEPARRDFGFKPTDICDVLSNMKRSVS